MHEFATRMERRFGFSGKELFRLLVSVLVATFILNFNKWGTDKFDLTAGLVSFLIIFFITFISFFTHFSAQKLVAIKLGYSAQYRYWINGFFISLVVCVFSSAVLSDFNPDWYIPLFFTGTLMCDVIPKLRVGVFRGGVNHKDLGLIAFAGPLSNIIIVGLIAPLYLATKNSFFHEVIFINLLIAVFSLLPIPTFEKIRQFAGGTTGLYLFIASRWVFVLVFVTVLVFSLLILLFNIFSYLLALLLGVIITIVYYSRFEMK